MAGAARPLVLPGAPAQPALRLVHAGGDPPAPRRRPAVVANGVLAMVFFLATETMIFGALISAYLILRAGTMLWPPADQPRLPIE